MGGNRSGEVRTYLNLFLTFVIGGLWHGASWMFVIWGALHGAALIVHRVWKSFGFTLSKWIAWLVTFNFINITWIYFRAKDLESANRILTGMIDVKTILGVETSSIPTDKLAWAGTTTDLLIKILPNGIFFNIFAYVMFALAFIIISQKNTSEISKYLTPTITRLNNRQLVYSALLFAISCLVMFSSTSSVFLYFNF